VFWRAAVASAGHLCTVATDVPDTIRENVRMADAMVALRTLHSLVDSDRQTSDEWWHPCEQVANTLETARRFVAAMQAAIDSSGRS
jgi:hypothetical protein